MLANKGIYRGPKGERVEVVGEVIDGVTQDVLIHYQTVIRASERDETSFVVPLTYFIEEVRSHDGRQRPRFEEMKDDVPYTCEDARIDDVVTFSLAAYANRMQAHRRLEDHARGCPACKQQYKVRVVA